MDSTAVRAPKVKAWVWAVLLPFAVLLTTSIIFRLGTSWWGNELGYLLGFAFYWLFWCLLVPWLAFRQEGLSSLLNSNRALFTRQNWHTALLWVTVTAVAIIMYGQDFVLAPGLLIILSLPFAIINGYCEEMLWRGVYVKSFPGNPWLGILYPALGFALWHIAPQTVLPDSAPVSFIVSTFFLGLVYGVIAYRTGSAKWTAISHSLNGVVALSGMLAPSVMRLLAP